MDYTGTHVNYWTRQPLYRDLFKRHGATMPVIDAEKFAQDRGTCLAILTAQSWDRRLRIEGDQVSTLDLVIAMGY